MLILGVLALSVDLWRDGIIPVKGVPVLTTLGATILAVTLSSMLSWRVQVAWRERIALNQPPGVEVQGGGMANRPHRFLARICLPSGWASPHGRGKRSKKERIT